MLPALKYSWSPNYNARAGKKVSLIVVHDCEGSFAGSVGWFMMAKSKVSAHIVLSEDGSQAVQMVGWDNKAWHVKDFNGVSEGIEAAGYAAKGLGKPEWQALASIVAWRLHIRQLQPVWARNGYGAGFCQHRDLGVRGGGHSDITSDPKVWQAFVEMVKAAYQEPQPATWVPGDVHIPAPTPVGFKPAITVRHDLIVGSLEWVQAELNTMQQLGVPILTVDGLDGPDTQKVVRSFQTAHGLKVDGIAGPKTIEAIQALI